MNNLVGQQFGNYHLTRLLGKGGFEEVYLGQHVRLNMQAARLPDVSPHDLRHRFGFRMAESVALHRLAQIMGHD